MFRWLALLALGGVGVGILLGEQIVGSRTADFPDEPLSFSSLSANPDAVPLQSAGAVPCPDCADSYGVAARLRVHRDDRMGDEFRKLGSTESDHRVPVDPDDDYSFGGRFPDPARDDGPVAAQVEDGLAITPDSDAPPIEETPLSPVNDD